MTDELSVKDDILATLSVVPPEVINPPASEEQIVEPGIDAQPPATVAVAEDAAIQPPPPETPPAAQAASDAMVPPVDSATPPEPTVEEVLRAEIARLSSLVTAGQLDSGTKQVFPPPVAPVSGEKPTEPTSVQPVVQTNPMQAIIDQLTQGFLTQEELDSVIDKPELINEAYSRSTKKFVENIFSLLPQLVNQTVAVEIQKNKLVTTFYEMYGDLKPYGDFVRLNMAEIEKANPDKTYKDIFEETAMVCRKRLGLKESSSVTKGVQPDGKPLPPAFAGSKGNSGKPGGPATKTTLFDENAADILELVSRQ